MKIGYLMQQGIQGLRTPPFSGPANHVVQVIKELTKLGHAIRVIAQWDGMVWKTDDLSKFDIVSTEHAENRSFRLIEKTVRRLQSELRLPYVNYFDSVRFAKACYQELKGYDLLYERTCWMGYGSLFAARWLKVPLILEQNGDHLYELDVKGIAPRGLQRWISMSITRKILISATQVIATGDGWRHNLIERWRVEPGKIVTVENGTELVKFLDRSQLRSFQSGNHQDGVTTLVYLGGFLPWHGIEILIQAFARVMAKGLKARLWLIGAGSGKNDAEMLVSDLGINDQVTFYGHLSPENYAPILANADIGLSPYCGWPEYSGLKILDYKASGLATISSGKDGMPPTLKHGTTGLIVPPCDVGALEEAMLLLINKPEWRISMGQRAREEAEALHGWDQTARRLSQIFSQQVSG